MARIALDAMGGDFAPRATVTGALLALRELDSAHSIQLVGRTDVITAQLDELLAEAEFSALRPPAQRGRLTVVEAPDVIEMTDKPATAIRGKPNSSMVVLRTHAGLKRPAIATIFPSARKPVVVLDSGANVDCSADELAQFARLGVVYAEDILGRDNPAVGLLSIGEEAEKGNAVVKEAHQLLQSAGLNFIGNVEGRDLPAGACDRGAIDVVVCDGFVGNVVLKFYEGIAPFIIGLLSQSGLDQKTMMAALRPLDYSEHGGAPLLGVNGVSIISHGKSSPRAIMNAIKVAVQAIEKRMDEHIGRRLAEGSDAQGAVVS